MPQDDLDPTLQEVARVPVLLVATDYDGTIAEIALEPALAVPHREALIALQTLADLPHTRAAVISGRSLSDLAHHLGSPPRLLMVGSHGSEFEPGFASALPLEVAALRARLLAEVYELSLPVEGTLVEEKPAGVALHYRKVADDDAALLLERIEVGPARHPGVDVRRGKRVIELSVVPTDKGRALGTLRRSVGASAVVFLGDDVTDEDAFATLHGADVGIKIGSGETRAAHRVPNTLDAGGVLARLADLRVAWTGGSAAVRRDAREP